MNDLEDARDPKVVIANSGRVSWVALEFQGCCLQRSETVGERNARSFVRFSSDLMPLDTLGDQAAMMQRAGAIKKAAEQLLVDIATLEAEGSA
jgi:hypothetical protein